MKRVKKAFFLKITQSRLVVCFSLLTLVFGCRTAEKTSSRPKTLFSAKKYQKIIEESETKIKSRLGDSGKVSGQDYINEIWQKVLFSYYSYEVSSRTTDCEDDMELIFTVLYHHWKTFGRDSRPAWVRPLSPFDPKGVVPGASSGVRHFFGGAHIQASINSGRTAQELWEWYSSKGTYSVDSYRDDAYAFVGAYFAETFDTWWNSTCSCMVSKFALPANKILLSDVFGDEYPLANYEGADKNELYRRRNQWVTGRKKNIDQIFKTCR